MFALRAVRRIKPTLIKVSKRYNHHGHDHHETFEYPVKSLISPTSVFFTVFSTVTVGLLINDRFNSKTGKSLVGDWLIPTPQTEEILKEQEEAAEHMLKLREDEITRRKFTHSFEPAYSIMYVFQSLEKFQLCLFILTFFFSLNNRPVRDVGPRSHPIGVVLEADEITERRPRQ